MARNNAIIGVLVPVIFFMLLARDAGAIHQEFKMIQDIEKQEKKVETQDFKIVLPHLEYKADGLRDPFMGYIQKKISGSVVSILQQQEAPVVPPQLTVQGVIWGGNLPQAIINHKVVKIGDTIEGAKITAIDKDGITILFKNKVFTIASPSAIQSEGLKQKAQGGQYEKTY